MKVSGVVYNHLPKIAARLPEAVTVIVQETAEEVRQTAQESAPVRSGRIKREIQIARPSPFRAVVGVPRGVFYSIYVEFGTARAAARPFLTPAFDKAKGRFFERMRGLVERIAQ